MDDHTLDPRLPHQYPETQPAAAQLHSHAIHTVGDLHTGQHWSPPEHLPATLRPYLQAILANPTHPAPRTPNPPKPNLARKPSPTKLRPPHRL